MTALPGALSSLMVKAVTRAARYMPDKPPDPLRHKHDQMGRPLPRVDGTPKVKGEALFAAEYRLDGLCYASLVYSTIAKGTISRIDTGVEEHRYRNWR
jgi:xanthine dehydrogenase YagR molybdenum-binding subunit